MDEIQPTESPSANDISGDHGRPRRDQPPNLEEANSSQETTLFNLKLDVKRVLLMWSQEKSEYVTKDDLEEEKKTEDDSAQYAFTIVRPVKPAYLRDVYWDDIRIHVRSQYFITAAKVVMKPQRNISWEADPVVFQYRQLLAFLPKFKEYRSSLSKSSDADPELAEIKLHLDFFIDFMELEYQDQLRVLRSLQQEQRVSFRLLWGIFVPGTLLLSNCEVSGEPIALRLVRVDTEDATVDKSPHYSLLCEYIDFSEGIPALAVLTREIPEFPGDMLLADFGIRPMYVEKNAQELRDTLIERGRRYWSLSKTWRHMQYSAIAWLKDDQGQRKTAVKSRIVLDRDLYDSYADHASPTIEQSTLAGQILVKRLTRKERVQNAELLLDDVMLIPVLLYGFSLSDRQWLQFDVNHVQEVTWNPESFRHLELADETKDLVKSLIHSHILRSAAFDDFVVGKGTGLILNLHGPPGVGKSLTAEAMCEVVTSPLYMVGAGDLGTTASELDRALNKIFRIATAWKAVVLIDEADVFLEERARDDLKRNAMVAVFLRQLEYFPGILILTTNRLESFDDAIKSRIHLSLTFEHLTPNTREKLWRAFLRKAGLTDNQISNMNMERMFQLPLNGREIKNIVQTAATFASHNKRVLTLEDLLRVTQTNKVPLERIVSSNGTEPRVILDSTHNAGTKAPSNEPGLPTLTTSSAQKDTPSPRWSGSATVAGVSTVLLAAAPLLAVTAWILQRNR
ncbi:hypothetical protein EW026_g1115 [Hermanssonia centrifuga]|uniref:AAA+ ATPase domain-containing protein n=1 Tax=Hermanssonia centrifuga TaxID=98765 RepID=A0A4S4KUB0_9APHY|nr:hypothetical protein EW026_g1115 [Hermanssonia centrifuga]